MANLKKLISFIWMIGVCLLISALSYESIQNLIAYLKTNQDIYLQFFLAFSFMAVSFVILMGISIFLDKITKAITTIANLNEETNKFMAQLLRYVKHDSESTKTQTDFLNNIIYGPAEIRLGKIDDKGEFQEMYNESFSSLDEFKKKKDEILAKLLGLDRDKNASKAIEDMGVDELERVKETAIKNEDYKKAALLRDKIAEIKDKQNEGEDKSGK